jgi:hypothetical protein
MLRPLEKNKTNKFFYLKILFLLFLIGVSLYGNYYFYNKPKQKPEVLSGTKKNNLSIDSILNEGKKTVEDLKQKGQEFGGQVLSVMEEKATQIASQSAKTVSDFVFDSTLVNILKQIEKLPKEQREKIKEEICR